MKIVINTNYNAAAGTMICVDALIPRWQAAGHEVTRNDWHNYDKYDLAYFMAPDSQVREAKKQNPRIVTGIMDPKLSTAKLRAEARAADFLAVSSMEQRDIFLQYNRNAIIYYMFPDIRLTSKTHATKDKIIIGYHGNKKHLEEARFMAAALDKLAEKHQIEFWAMYNVAKLGRWTKNLPAKCPVKHLQWSEENYYQGLGQCDIGVVPVIQPPVSRAIERLTTAWRKLMGDDFSGTKKHYLLKFKHSAGPGRVFVFSRLGIPVVADFAPSVCQIIEDGVSGLLVYSPLAWEEALGRLIDDPELRNRLSRNLADRVESNFSLDKNFAKLEAYLVDLCKKKQDL